MKILVSIILIAAVSFALSLYLPWWCIAVAAFGISTFIVQKPWLAFVSGFTAILLLWGALSWGISAANNHLLASKISVLIMNDASPMLLILITALAGALVAGFASMSGSLLRRLF